MANQEHIAILKEGPAAWNEWRAANPDIKPDLRGVNLVTANLVVGMPSVDISHAPNIHEATAIVSGSTLTGLNLLGADLRGAKLMGAHLRLAVLSYADLSEADLSGAILWSARCNGARFDRATLTKSTFRRADLGHASFRDACMRSVDLSEATLVGTDLSGADLTCAQIFGLSAWDLQLDQTIQSNLRITREDDAEITVDNLEVAQFLYLLLKNEKIRYLIDTITSKVVLVLGRFTRERKAILNHLRDDLRKHGYSPVVFDFEKPSSRDLTETVSTLAHLARFVIADITDAKSIPQELKAIVPSLPSVPIRPIIDENQYEYGMFKDFGGYLSVLPPYRYRNIDNLLKSLEEEVIGPALCKAQEIDDRRKEFENELAK